MLTRLPLETDDSHCHKSGTATHLNPLWIPIAAPFGMEGETKAANHPGICLRKSETHEVFVLLTLLNFPPIWLDFLEGIPNRMNHVLDEIEQWPNSHDFAIQLGIYHIAGYLSI